MLDFVLFALPAGVWVDRLRRRPLLIATCRRWSRRETLVEAKPKLEGSRAAMNIAGPGVAGLLIGLLKAPVAIAVDAASFVVSALSIASIRRPEPGPHARTERRPMRAELAEGLRYAFGDRYLRSLIGCTGAWNLFSSMGLVVLLVYLVRRLGFAPEELGGVFTLGSLGALGGALAARPLGARLGIGRTIVGGALVVGPGIAWIALAPTLPGAPVVIVTIFFAAFAGVAFNINQLSLRQAITPPRLHGRMNAVVRVMYWGGAPLGALLGGALAAAIGIRLTLVVSGAVASVSFLPLLWSPIRSISELPEAAGEPPADLSALDPAHA